VIFVTVGTQLPFDRMIRAVEAWAASAPDRQLFAQIGPTSYVPRGIESSMFISPAECRQRMLDADAIVAHAGMGTIISALELGKPLLVMPRMASLGEHRNDHQIATAKRFAELGRVAVAEDAQQLAVKLDELDELTVRDRISPHASGELITALSAFINR
jgi:UDP-N-acetylglucosamine transferase subunit ALG13